MLCLWWSVGGVGCDNQPNRSPEISFYHWKTTFQPSEKAQQYLKKLLVKRLYVRFFDVDWREGQAVPVADLMWKDTLSAYTIIPVVFITNRTIKSIEEKEIPMLAQQIAKRIRKQAERHQLSLEEVQFDCDWSETTGEKFFTLLKQLRIYLPEGIALSATIRLHQLKYTYQTGVPPVDRGVLMFYNMGNLDGSNTQNSILDLDIAAAYLKGVTTYPLPLDFALPIYQWLVVKRRTRIVHLINDVALATLANSKNFQQTGARQFTVSKSHYFRSVYLYKGDELRVEGVSLVQLQKAAEMLAPLVNHTPPRVIFYHLENTHLKQFTPNEFQKLVEVF